MPNISYLNYEMLAIRSRVIMVKRNPISSTQNIWYNGQPVDDVDLGLEQTFNNTINSAIINNHIGVGVLPEVLVQNILFDSHLATGYLDGLAIYAQNQPSDNNLGNQLEISLNDSMAGGRKTVKVAIIGLDFQGNLQYETFIFKKNEIQISRKHFANILLIMFNDLLGNPDLSFNLGGNLLIKEAKPLSLSRHPIMVAQDVQPNIFFRDFFLEGGQSLSSFLQESLPLYNTETLNIYTNELDNNILSSGDVTTQIGEKFIATTNNIQKISLLLSVRNLIVGSESDLVWNGDLVVSIYPLQSDVNCSSDIAPNLPIDFSPSNVPLAQISINYASLEDSGVRLDSIPQPIDFVFSNSPIASGNVLIPGSFYAISIKRSGSANKCDIIISTGGNLIADSRVTIFTGGVSNLWVDIPEQQLWFQVYNDAAKISDGQAYESGFGVILPKTILDEISQSTIDYSKDAIQFSGTNVFSAVVAATTEQTVPVPDQRTGNPVLSRQQFIPSISLLNTIDIANLEKVSEPLVIGTIIDKNRKFFDSISSLINSKLHSSTLVGDELLIKLITDTTDPRLDGYVNSLATNLLQGDFEGAKIVTNKNNINKYYRIASSSLCTMVIGDVDGDGIITNNDLDLLTKYMDYNLSTALPLDTQFTTDSITSTFINGYNFATSPIIYPTSNQSLVHFQLINSITNSVNAEFSDGYLTANPADPSLAQFSSASVVFNSFVGLDGYHLMVDVPSELSVYGAFNIIANDIINNVLTLRKILLTGNTVSEMLRADIDGDFHITSNDGYLLQQYVERFPLTSSPVPPYPAPTSNAFANIGKTFDIIKFKLEQFIDRTDDYASSPYTRAMTVHPIPDAFKDDGYFHSHDFYTSPVPIIIEKKLTWNESLLTSNSNSKSVPSVYPSLTGFIPNQCGINRNPCNIYASQPDFDPGRVDYFIPNNMILGEAGELKRPDGEFYKVDFEIGTIVLEVPDGLFGTERTINILNDFISDYENTGVTRLGFPAMKFADCTFVQPDSLSKDQLRFSVSVQSFSPNISGLSEDGYEGIIVDGKIGIYIDYATGFLTLNFTNLFQDPTLKTLSTKIQINVFLKKGGFNNQPLFVDSNKMNNMLSLISVFSGANVGGISAVITGSDVVYTPTTPSDWAGSPPATVQEALDRIAANFPGVL